MSWSEGWHVIYKFLQSINSGQFCIWSLSKPLSPSGLNLFRLRYLLACHILHSFIFKNNYTISVVVVSSYLCLHCRASWSTLLLWCMSRSQIYKSSVVAIELSIDRWDIKLWIILYTVWQALLQQYYDVETRTLMLKIRTKNMLSLLSARFVDPLKWRNFSRQTDFWQDRIQ